MCTLKVMRPTASQHTVYLTLKEYIRYIYNWNWNLTSPLTVYTYGNNRLHDVCSCFIKRLEYNIVIIVGKPQKWLACGMDNILSTTLN